MRSGGSAVLRAGPRLGRVQALVCLTGGPGGEVAQLQAEGRAIQVGGQLGQLEAGGLELVAEGFDEGRVGGDRGLTCCPGADGVEVWQGSALGVRFVKKGLNWGSVNDTYGGKSGHTQSVD